MQPLSSAALRHFTSSFLSIPELLILFFGVLANRFRWLRGPSPSPLPPRIRYVSHVALIQVDYPCASPMGQLWQAHEWRFLTVLIRF